MSAQRQPAIFIDKDGTLLDDVPYNVDIARMRFAPGAQRGLRLLARTGRPLVVVSNQSGVALGRFPEARLHEVGAQLQHMFAHCGAQLADFRWCPHAPLADGTPACACRKPASGMLHASAAALRLDLARSWLIGDILDDIEAAHRAGCRAVLIDNGNETQWRAGPLRVPEHCVPDFEAAAHCVLAAEAIAA